MIPEAEKYIALINEKLAGKEMENAVFYFRQKRYVSSLIYLDKIIAEYPDNTQWVEAKYLKAKILFLRGERKNEAVELLRQVIGYPAELRIKKDAEILLAQIEKG